MRVLHAIDRRAIPWKNGGGVTRQVAGFPIGSDLESFDWRVSIAEVRASGPFSRFPHIDRRIAVLKGRASLQIENRAPVELDIDTPPLSFPGDVPSTVELIGGPVIDLNVMTRRNRFESRLRRRTLDGSRQFSANAGVTLVFALADLTLAVPDAHCRLEEHDAVLFEPGDHSDLKWISGRRDVFLVEIFPVAPL